MSSIKDESCDVYCFYDAEIENVDDSNFTEISLLLKDKDFVRSQEVQVFVDSVIDAKSNISAGKGTIAEYELLGIDGVTNDFIEEINSAEKLASIDKGADLNVEEIKGICENIIN